MERQDEEDYKLYIFVKDNCCRVLQDVIQTLFIQDGISDFQNFLDINKHILFHQWVPNKSCCICAYRSIPHKKPLFTFLQWSALYQRSKSLPPHSSIGDCPCLWQAIQSISIRNIDVTLSCLLLNIIYPSKLSGGQNAAITHIRLERNKLFHSEDVSETFETRWSKLEAALADLTTNCLSDEDQQLMLKQVQELKTKSMISKECVDMMKFVRHEVLYQIGQKQRNVEEALQRIEMKLQCSPVSEQSSPWFHPGSFETDPSDSSLQKDDTFSAMQKDIEDTQTLITDLQDILKVTPENDNRKRFIKRFTSLKKSFEKCKTPDDMQRCAERYKDLTVDWATDNLRNCWKELQPSENVDPVYTAKDFRLIDEKEFKRLACLNYTMEQMKHEEQHRKLEIDNKLKRAIMSKHIHVNPENREELRIVIVGKTGVGKSALGNLILGIENYFTESNQASSATATVKEGNTEVDNRYIRILDTPGMFDTERSHDVVHKEFKKCIRLFEEGFHAMAYVMNGSNLKYTAEEENAIRRIRDIFSDNVFGFCFLVITHMDGFDDGKMTVSQFLEDNEQDGFSKVVEDFGGRVMFIENRAKTDYEKDGFRTNFLGMVDVIKIQQKGKVYDHKWFKKYRELRESQKSIEAERRIKDLKEKEIRRVKKVVRRVQEEAENEIARLILDEVDAHHTLSNMEESVLSYVVKKIRKEDVKYLGTRECKIMEAICSKTVVKVRENINTIVGEANDKGRVQQLIIDKIRDAQSKNKRIDLTDDQLFKEICEEIPHAFSNDFCLDDIYLHFDCGDDPIVKELSNSIRRLIDEIYKKIVEIAELYFNEELEKDKNCSKTDAFKYIKKKLRGQLSEEALQYFALKTFEEEILFKIDIEMEKRDAERVVCFPGDVTVTCSRGPVPLSDIRIGDKVLTFNFNTETVSFEDVILLSHAEPDILTDMIQITTSCSKTITLSAGHLIYINETGNLVPARQVKKGDNLLVCTGNGVLWSSVCDVTMVTKMGLYCPHTIGGSLFVTGILVSCGTDQVPSAVTNAVMFGVTLLYKYLPSTLFRRLYGQNRLQDAPYLLTKLKPWYLKMNRR